jgi:hypothetical protein
MEMAQSFSQLYAWRRDMTKSLISVAIVFLLVIALLASCTGVPKNTKGCANCGEIFPVSPEGGGLKGGGGGP